MIVPILEPSLESVIGTIDVESVRVNAFSDEDRALAEQCAAVLIPLFTERSMA
jgi:putative methionine-R-sulfoxide reductase with GAF domain